MKKLVMVAILVLVCASMMFSQAKPGGIAREAAMGGSQAGTGLVLNPFIMDDPSLMLVNPAYQAWYHDYGWSNIGGGGLTGANRFEDGYGLQNAGVAFSLNDSWNLGAVFSYDPSLVNVVSSLVPLVEQRAPRAIPSVQNVWELVASTKSGSTDWGFGLMYGWSSNSATSSTVNPTTSSDASASAWMLGLRAGLIADLGNGNLFDASAAYRMDKASDNITVTPTANGSGGQYSASGTELQFNARAKFKQSAKFNLVPYGMLLLLSAEPKEDAPPTGVTAQTGSVKPSGMAYALGLGGELHTTSFYLAGGLSFESAQLKTDVNPGGQGATTTTYTAKYTEVPVVNLGGEWWFTDWLAGRAGYFRYIGTYTYRVEGTTATLENSGSGFPVAPSGFPSALQILPVPGVHSFSGVGGLNPSNWDGVVTLGVGLKFGGWAMDATVSDEALRRGLGLIGSQDNINTFGYITASYNFAE